MKMILLMDGSTSEYFRMVEELPNKKTFLIDTQHCDEIHEFKYLLNTIDEFTASNKDIMLVKFSGRECVYQALGDECSGMIVFLSYNKNSRHYTENPTILFLDIINLFKGD